MSSKKDKHWRFKNHKHLQGLSASYNVIEVSPAHYRFLDNQSDEIFSEHYIDTELEDFFKEKYQDYDICFYTLDYKTYVQYEMIIDFPFETSTFVQLWEDEKRVVNHFPVEEINENVLLMQKEWLEKIKGKKENRIFFITGIY
jgi:hypothetical protein